MSIAALLLLVSAPTAQVGTPAGGARKAELVLQAGTAVRLKTVTTLHSKTNRQGERFEMIVDEDVRVGSHIAIPRGSPAFGEIAKQTAKGPYGKAGGLELRLLYASVGDRRIRLDGEQAEKGASSEAAAIVTGFVSGAIGAFISGKSASVPAGTILTGYVHRDLPLLPSK
nr:hypothetical protein [uncultured Sphingosinicella sp.]